MNNTSISQFYSFLIFIGIGIILVLIFDVFRIFRKTFKTSDLVTTIEDIIFAIIAAFILLYSIFKFNSGEIRSYIFLGIITGATAYIATVSKFFIKISVTIIEFTKKIILGIINIIIFPLKIIFDFIRKIFFKPISFFFINFKKFSTNVHEKFNCFSRKNKVKKGF